MGGLGGFEDSVSLYLPWTSPGLLEENRAKRRRLVRFAAFAQTHLQTI
jgi:hypothetical protein